MMKIFNSFMFESKLRRQFLAFVSFAFFMVNEIDDRRALSTLCLLACSVTQLIIKGL